MYDYIALVRCNPALHSADQLSAALTAGLEAAENSLVFLHGDGVGDAYRALSRPGRYGADWVVCQTSWARRQASEMPRPPFRTATLVALFDGLDGARRVDSFGLGGWFCCRPDAVPANHRVPRKLLLEIGFAPADERRRRETLEMALGAAALELEAAVLFQGEGLRHLEGEAAGGWKQITDFGLMEMFVETGAGRSVPEIAVQAVDSPRAAQLRGGAGTILLL